MTAHRRNLHGLPRPIPRARGIYDCAMEVGTVGVLVFVAVLLSCGVVGRAVETARRLGR